MVNHSEGDGAQTGSASAITVAVRVRPFSALPAGSGRARSPSASSLLQVPTEAEPSSSSVRKIVNVIDEQVLVFDPADASFRKRRRTYVHGAHRNKEVQYAFDRVFGESASQDDVYKGTAKPLIDGVLDGYNSTVFAYGATGCGKTHTITGTPEDPGIIFLTMRELFARIDEASTQLHIETSVSYLEVYNEAIKDLLKPTSTESLDLREDDSNSRVVVAGLSEHKPRDVDHVMDLMITGNNNRTKAPTEANAVSSRSHAVLQIHVRLKDKAAGINSTIKTATLSIIDLAGSERASVTKNSGQRLLEGANINRSLLALGNCINALCSDRPNHIPYRDSKLTRLLKYSLGGNCRVVMIAAISASSVHYEDTHNTLKYANRAKNIKTKVEQNTIDVAAHMAQYPKIISELQAEVQDLRDQLLGRQEQDLLHEKLGGRQPVSVPIVVAEQTSSADTGMRADAFEMLLAKVRKIFSKLESKEDEKADGLAEVDKNERRLGMLRATMAALISQDASASSTGHAANILPYAETLRNMIEAIHSANVSLRHNANQARIGILGYNEEINKMAADTSSRPRKRLAPSQRERLRVEIQLLKLASQNRSLARQVETCQRALEAEADAFQKCLTKMGECLRELQSVTGRARDEDLLGEEVVTLVEATMQKLSVSLLPIEVESHFKEGYEQKSLDVVEVNWDSCSEASDFSDMSTISQSDGNESDGGDGGWAGGDILTSDLLATHLGGKAPPSNEIAIAAEPGDTLSPPRHGGTPEPCSPVDEPASPATACPNTAIKVTRPSKVTFQEDRLGTPTRSPEQRPASRSPSSPIPVPGSQTYKRQASPRADSPSKKARSDEEREVDADATPMPNRASTMRKGMEGVRPPRAPDFGAGCAIQSPSKATQTEAIEEADAKPLRRSQRRVARQSLLPVMSKLIGEDVQRRQSALPRRTALGPDNITPRGSLSSAPGFRPSRLSSAGVGALDKNAGGKDEFTSRGKPTKTYATRRRSVAVSPRTIQRVEEEDSDHEDENVTTKANSRRNALTTTTDTSRHASSTTKSSISTLASRRRTMALSRPVAEDDDGAVGRKRRASVIPAATPLSGAGVGAKSTVRRSLRVASASLGTGVVGGGEETPGGKPKWK